MAALGELMDTAMERFRTMADGSTVIGQAITTPDGLTLIPVSRISFGFVSGGNDKPAKSGGQGVWGGGGAAVKIEPLGFLMEKDGGARMVSIQPPAFTTADRILDLVPEVLDKVERYVEKHEKKRHAAP